MRPRQSYHTQSRSKSSTIRSIKMTIPISLAVEGELDERVLRELLKQSGCSFAPGVCYGKRGKDNLWQNVLQA